MFSNQWTFSTYNYSRFIWISCTEQCIFKSYLSRKSFLIVMISEEGTEEDRRRLSRAPPGLTLLYSTKELILRNCCSIIKRSLLPGRTYAQQHDLYIQLIINDLWSLLSYSANHQWSMIVVILAWKVFNSDNFLDSLLQLGKYSIVKENMNDHSWPDKAFRVPENCTCRL